MTNDDKTEIVRLESEVEIEETESAVIAERPARKTISEIVRERPLPIGESLPPGEYTARITDVQINLHDEIIIEYKLERQKVKNGNFGQGAFYESVANKMTETIRKSVRPVLGEVVGADRQDELLLPMDASARVRKSDD